jgi:transposase InsO family protein
MSKLSCDSSIVCSRHTHDICHACQLGHHTHLLFVSSNSRVNNNFDLIHCDLWASPIVSISGYKYYLVILDDHSHFVWTFPVRDKSDTFSTLSNLFAYLFTEFHGTIKAIQYDNGREFHNASSHSFFATIGVLLWMSCPYNSPQNGKAECIIHTTNNLLCSLLLQASILTCYWV